VREALSGEDTIAETKANQQDGCVRISVSNPIKSISEFKILPFGCGFSITTLITAPYVTIRA
jgi:hypothetical protein